MGLMPKMDSSLITSRLPKLGDFNVRLERYHCSFSEKIALVCIKKKTKKKSNIKREVSGSRFDCYNVIFPELARRQIKWQD